MSRDHFFVIRETKGSVVCILVLIFLFLSCSSENERVVDEIAREFQRRNYGDVILLSERALEKGFASGKIYYYYGMALVRTGSDFEAFGKLEKAAKMEASLAPSIAEELFGKGRDYFAMGKRKQAAACMRAAAKIDPGLNLGAFMYLVAEDYYNRGDYRSASHYYGRAVEAFPDTVIAGKAYLQLADSFLRMKMEYKAEEIYRDYLERFEGKHGKESARWQLARILLSKGEKAVELGNYQQAVEAGEEILDITENIAVKQRALFMVGRAYEGMGEYSRALESFKEIIRIDQGALGSTYGKAVKKLDEYKRAGF